MKKTILFVALFCGLFVASHAKAQDYLAARLRMEKELNYICSTSLGVRYGSATYYECREYYDRRFYDYGLDWDYLTPAEVTVFLTRTNPYIDQCRNKGLVSTLLWGCIRYLEDDYYEDWHRHHPHHKPTKEYHPHFKRDEPHRGPGSRPYFDPHRPDRRPHFDARKPDPKPHFDPHRDEPRKPDPKPIVDPHRDTHKPDPKPIAEPRRDTHKPDPKPIADPRKDTHKPDPKKPATDPKRPEPEAIRDFDHKGPVRK